MQNSYIFIKENMFKYRLQNVDNLCRTSRDKELLSIISFCFITFSQKNETK